MFESLGRTIFLDARGNLHGAVHARCLLSHARNSISDSGESSSIADVTTFAASYDSDVMESGTIVSISEDSEASIDAACGEQRARER